MLVRLILCLCLLVQPVAAWACELMVSGPARACAMMQRHECCGATGPEEQAACAARPMAPCCPGQASPRNCCTDVQRLPGTTVRLEARARPETDLANVLPRVRLAVPVNERGRERFLARDVGPSGVSNAARARLCVWVI